MKLLVISILSTVMLLLFTSTDSFCQSLRGLVNDGVENYNENNYADAEVNFKKGVENSPGSFEAKFNLGDALFKQERYDEAINSYQSAMPVARNDLEKARVHYNIGNSLLKSQKVKESIEEYKQSLKLNSNDQEAKYNLSYALELLKNQNEQEQQNKDQDQQQNKDENQEENENKDQKKQDQQKDQQQQQDQKKQDQQSKQDNTEQQKQQPQKISKEEAERILEALKDNEKDLQKKLRKIKGKRVNTDKDW
ncbi:tetratricopeptide repeat protein [Bacteroidota bacterium]